jgi:hypothetical protein
LEPVGFGGHAAKIGSVDAVSIILAEREESAILMVITLWTLWTNRNAVREEGRRKRDEELARSIRVYVNEIS